MKILHGHKSTKPVRSLAFSPDGTKLASSARDYKTLLWDLETGQSEVTEPSDSYTVTFSPDGKTVATGRGSDLSLWHADARQFVRHSIRYTYGEDTWGHGWNLAYSPDGTRLAAVSGNVRVFDTATMEELPLPAVLGADPAAHSSWEGTLASRFATNSLAFSRDGSVLATGHDGAHKVVRLWDTNTWEVRAQLFGSTAKLTALAFSPDGEHLAACAGTALVVWEVASGKIVAKHVANTQHCKDVVYAPDGNSVAVAMNDASVRFISTANWREIRAYDWDIGPMISLAIAPDGLRVAGGSGKGRIVVFDVDL